MNENENKNKTRDKGVYAGWGYVLVRVKRDIVTAVIRPEARKGYGSIAHSASPHGLLTRGL